jgi:hypothetical protein
MLINFNPFKSKGVRYVVNILAWDRLPEGEGSALPMCGGFFSNYFEHSILSMAVNTKVLCDIMVKGTNEVITRL